MKTVMRPLPDSESELNWAGLNFRIRGEGWPLCHISEPFHRNFLSGRDREAEREGEAIDVVFEAGALPGDGEMIFDSGGPWRMLAREDRRVFLLHPPAFPSPCFAAAFRLGGHAVRVTVPGTVMVDGREYLPTDFRYPLDQILTMYFLLGKGVIVHAAGLIYKGMALAFAGVSGAGKSTISRLALGRENWKPVNDDRVILRKDESGPFTLFGTPWPGEGKIAENASAPLRALFFLEKGARNAIRPIKKRESLTRLFPTVTIPWYDPIPLETGLDLLGTLTASVPAAVLTVVPETSVFELIESFLEGNPHEQN